MRRFANALLSQRWATLLLAGLAVAAGIVAWIRLPIDAFPDVTNIQVMVLTKAAGLSSEDVEQQVTYPIEQQLGGLPGIVQVRSMSKAGLSQVVIVFQDGTDPKPRVLEGQAEISAAELG